MNSQYAGLQAGRSSTGTQCHHPRRQQFFKNVFIFYHILHILIVYGFIIGACLCWTGLPAAPFFLNKQCPNQRMQKYNLGGHVFETLNVCRRLRASHSLVVRAR